MPLGREYFEDGEVRHRGLVRVSLPVGVHDHLLNLALVLIRPASKEFDLPRLET